MELNTDGSNVQHHIANRTTGEPPRSELSTKLVKWLFFTVLVGIIPVVGTIFARWIRVLPMNIEDLFGRADLALISVAIALVAAGEAFVTSHRSPRQPALIGGSLSVVIAVISAICYSDAIRAIEEAEKVATPALTALGPTVSPDRIAVMSLTLFILTFLVGTLCVYYSTPPKESPS